MAVDTIHMIFLAALQFMAVAEVEE